jgi:hypothetical protein
MNRRVLAALITLADLHRAEEDPTMELEISAAYGRHGVALRALDPGDEETYHEIARRISASRAPGGRLRWKETIDDDPVGAELLMRARAGTLPYRIKAEDEDKYAHLLAPRAEKKES